MLLIVKCYNTLSARLQVLTDWKVWTCARPTAVVREHPSQPFLPVHSPVNKKHCQSARARSKSRSRSINTSIIPTSQMQLSLERKTVFSVGEEDVLALLRDTKRFLVASGSSDESSICFDEAIGRWKGMWLVGEEYPAVDVLELTLNSPSATSKDGIPMLPKPSYTAKMEETEQGARWTIEAGLGIKMTHVWTVEPVSDQECTATEAVTCDAPFFAFYAVKWQLPQTQEKTHRALQMYLS